MVSKAEDKVEERDDAHRRAGYSVKRDLFVKPLLKLKQQEDIIERGLTAPVNNMKIDANLLQDIVQEYRELSSKRQSFVNALYKNMEDIASELESAKYMVNNPEEMKNLDINTYKLKLIKLSQKMQDFKKSCSIQTLVDEQSALDTELREFQPQLQKYESVQERANGSSGGLLITDEEPINKLSFKCHSLCYRHSRNREDTLGRFEGGSTLSTVTEPDVFNCFKKES